MAHAPAHDPDSPWMMSELDGQRLKTLRLAVDKIYHDIVVIKKHQRKHNMAYCKPIIERILAYISSKSSIFRGVLICVGSAYQGFKVGEANEYDYNIPLNISSPFGQAEYRFGFGLYGFNKKYDNQEMTLATIPDDCSVTKLIPCPASSPDARPRQPQPSDVGPGFRYARPQGNVDIVHFKTLAAPGEDTPDIIPFLVRRALFQTLVAALRDLHVIGDVQNKRRNNWPALTIDISEHGSFVASVDFTPIISSGDFTLPEKINLPRRGKHWPTPTKIAQIEEHHGPNLVAMKPFHWQISYAECEKELSRNLDFDGGCRKKAHRIMKEINKTIWCPTTKSAISSYMLRNILFWECERYPETERWVQDKLWIRIESMTKALLHALEIRNLPQFFDIRINLVSQRDQQECIIAKEKPARNAIRRKIQQNEPLMAPAIGIS